MRDVSNGFLVSAATTCTVAAMILATITMANQRSEIVLSGAFLFGFSAIACLAVLFSRWWFR
jgi:hypothetical protein